MQHSKHLQLHPQQFGSHFLEQLVMVLQGNSASCSSTVTVVDSTSPTAVCQNLTVQLDVGGDTDHALEGPDADGNVAAVLQLTEGEHTLSLTATDTDGLSNTEAVTIQVGAANSAPTCGFTAPTDGASGPAGGSVTLAIEANDADEGPESLTVALDSSIDGALGSGSPDASGAFSVDATLSLGAHTLTVTVTDELGDSCTDSITWQQGSPPTVVITDPSPGTQVNQGDTVTFTATVSDIEDSPDSLFVSWSSDLDGVLSTASADAGGTATFDHDSLTAGLHVVTLTTTDSDGLATSSSVDLAVNGLPSAPDVSLSPDPAVTADDLVASIDTDSVDPEGDTVTYSYAWSVDGVASSASTTATLPASATAKGELWTVTVIPNDGSADGYPGGASVTIGNTAPSVTSAAITPDPAVYGDTLTCSHSGYADVDGDADASTYAWTINGTAAGSGSTLTSGFSGGDTVACTVTPHDGTDAGTPVSTSITVDNTAPELASVSLSPTTVYEGDTLTCTPGTATDVDGDTITYIYRWTVDGTSTGTTSSTLSSSYFDKGETVVCSVQPTDGTDTGASVSSNAVTISNTAPTGASASLTPTTAYEADTLTCTGSGATDADGDTVSYTYEWTINGSTSSRTAATIDGGYFDRGDVVLCEVTAIDRDGQEAMRRTAEIEIANSPPSFTTDPRDVRKLDGLQLRAEDPDGDKLRYSLTGAPAGMTIDKDRGVIKYKGSTQEKGGQYQLEAKVDDGAGGTATWKFGIAVSAGSDTKKKDAKDDGAPPAEEAEAGGDKKRERRRTAW